MRKLILLICLLLICVPVVALPNYITWEIRTTGADTNGGGFNPGANPTGGTGATVCTGGTDYSKQDAAQVVFDGATITAVTGGTSATITITGYTVATTDKCNVLQITGGTNFTTGFYAINSVDTGANTWTLDRNVSSGIGAAMTGNMGGALATDAKLLITAGVSGGNAIGQTAWMKAGTYTKTAATNIAGAVQGLTIRGYTTTRGDATNNQPVVITTATNSTKLYTIGATSVYGLAFYNIKFTNTAGTRAEAFYASTGGPATQLMFIEYLFDGFTTAVRGDFNTDYYFNGLWMINGEVKNSTLSGIIHYGDTYLFGSRFTANTGNGALVGIIGSTHVDSCVFDNNTLDGLNGTTSGGQRLFVKNSVFYANTLSGIHQSSSAQRPGVVFINNVFEANVRYGIEAENVENIAAGASYNNAFYNNTLGATTGWFAGVNQVTYSATAFTNAGSSDFSLNSTAGGGAALKALGFPGVTGFQGTGYIDIGALQSQGLTATPHNAASIQ